MGTSPPGEDFASMLAGFATRSIETMRQGEQAAVAGINGAAPIQEVVDKVMAAEQALQSSLAVREKVVSAWLEISRMTI
jgi:flagellar hook-basal body complex protein FliE